MRIRQYGIIAGGQRLNVHDSGGSGSPIVMIHGSGASGTAFSRQFASPLAESHRLIAIDLPGHGGSENARNPEHDYTINALAETLSEALAKLSIGKAVVFAWSLGGHIALQAAARDPAVAGLFLVGTPPLARGPLGLLRAFQTKWDMLLTTKASFSEQEVERFTRLCFGTEAEPQFYDAVRRSDGRLRVHLFRSLLHGTGIDQKAFVENSKIPIAVLNGENDPFVRLGYIRELAYARLWRGRCHIVPATGHAPFWHAPQLVNPLIEAFARAVKDDIEGVDRRRRVA